MQKEIVTQEQIKAIRDYYKYCNLWLPQNSQHRSWKFKLTDNTWKKFFIKDEKELRKLLVKYTPLRVFYSAIVILNIQNIKGKQNKNFPIKLFQDLIIDIDHSDFDKARKSALRVIDILGHPSYILKTYKGTHLNYFKQGKNKKEYLELIKNIPFIDTKTILNDYNEFSCPLTLNKGKVCIFLTYEQLKNSSIEQLQALQPQIYEFIPNITPITLETPIEANETGLARPFSRLSTLRSRSKQWVDETGTGVTVLSFNNQVKHLYIPILIYNKNLKGLKQELDYLVNHYELGNLYVFKSENNIAFISLRVMNRRRLSKILNSSRSITKQQWFKFNKIWFNFSEWIPLTKIDYSTQKCFRASRKHHEAFCKIGFPESNQINEFVGKTPLEIYEVGIN